MPTEYSNCGYTVVVEDDRSILVKEGDWISKYAAAIYGDPLKNWNRFKRKQGASYIDLEDHNKITTGERIYHPSRLPKEIGMPPGAGPGRGKPTPPIEDPEPDEPAANPNFVKELLDWVHGRFVKTDWEVTGTSSGDISGLFMTYGYNAVEITHKQTKASQWYQGFASGLTFGLDSGVGAAFAPSWFPSSGTVLRSPFRTSIDAKDFNHGIVVFEIGAQYYKGLEGNSACLVFFGISAPIVIIRELARYVTYGNIKYLQEAFNRTVPSGVLCLKGNTFGLPGFGVACRLGFMYDRPSSIFR